MAREVAQPFPLDLSSAFLCRFRGGPGSSNPKLAYGELVATKPNDGQEAGAGFLCEALLLAACSRLVGTKRFLTLPG